MTPSVRTIKGSKTKGFQGSTPLCPRGSNARGFSNVNTYYDDVDKLDYNHMANEKVLVDSILFINDREWLYYLIFFPEELDSILPFEPEEQDSILPF